MSSHRPRDRDLDRDRDRDRDRGHDRRRYHSRSRSRDPARDRPEDAGHPRGVRYMGDRADNHPSGPPAADLALPRRPGGPRGGPDHDGTRYHGGRDRERDRSRSRREQRAPESDRGPLTAADGYYPSYNNADGHPREASARNRDRERDRARDRYQAPDAGSRRAGGDGGAGRTGERAAKEYDRQRNRDLPAETGGRDRERIRGDERLYDEYRPNAGGREMGPPRSRGGDRERDGRWARTGERDEYQDARSGRSADDPRKYGNETHRPHEQVTDHDYRLTSFDQRDGRSYRQENQPRARERAGHREQTRSSSGSREAYGVPPSHAHRDPVMPGAPSESRHRDERKADRHSRSRSHSSSRDSSHSSRHRHHDTAPQGDRHPRRRSPSPPPRGRRDTSPPPAAPAKPAEKPNYAPSGALNLAATTVTLASGRKVQLKYTPPPDATAPLPDKWALMTYRGDQPVGTYEFQPTVSARSALRDPKTHWIVGRDPEVADIVLDTCKGVSGQHAAIQFRQTRTARGPAVVGSSSRSSKCVGVPYLIDLDSTNGTYLNEVKVEAARYIELQHKDVIRLAASQREMMVVDLSQVNRVT